MKYIRKKMLEEEENNMSKSLLLSINPQYVAKILNGEKTIEIRKRFPKDYRGWVYIYCTKGIDVLYTNILNNNFYLNLREDHIALGVEKRNGKVVARFYCDNVEKFYAIDKELCKLSCLFPHEINNYLQGKTGYAIHISQLEIFNKPKELSEFYKVGAREQFEHDSRVFGKEQAQLYMDKWFRITKAPQSYMYVEVAE